MNNTATTFNADMMFMQRYFVTRNIFATNLTDGIWNVLVRNGTNWHCFEVMLLRRM